MGLTVWLYVRTLGGCVCVSGKHVRDVISVYACVRETLVWDKCLSLLQTNAISFIIAMFMALQ